LPTVLVSNPSATKDAQDITTTDASEVNGLSTGGNPVGNPADWMRAKDLDPDYIFHCIISGGGSTARLKVYASVAKKDEENPSAATLDANQYQVATQDKAAPDTHDFVLTTKYDYLKLTITRVGAPNTSVKTYVTARGNKGA